MQLQVGKPTDAVGHLHSDNPRINELHLVLVLSELPGAGVEPARLAAQDFKSCVSAYSTISAWR